jgi:DNA invertase Pin-like site-specific DNA recombinase
VALYARVSTRDNDQDPEVQLVPLREYVAARGLEAVKPFAAAIISTFDPGRVRLFNTIGDVPRRQSYSSMRAS